MKINKAEFSHMLKKVRDQVLKARNIVQAFSASGMHPLSFAASYAYKQVPPHPQWWLLMKSGSTLI